MPAIRQSKNQRQKARARASLAGSQHTGGTEASQGSGAGDGSAVPPGSQGGQPENDTAADNSDTQGRESGGDSTEPDSWQSGNKDDHPMKGVRFQSMTAPGPTGTRAEHAKECFACGSNVISNRLARAMLKTQDKIQKGQLIPEAQWVKRTSVAFLEETKRTRKYRDLSEWESSSARSLANAS